MADQFLYASLYVDADTFPSATVTRGPVDLSPSLFTNTNTFYSPLVLQDTITPALYVDPDTFYSTTVTVGPVNLQPALFTNTTTFHEETVATVPVYYIRKDITPGTPSTPGDPGQPWIPAYCYTTTGTTTSGGSAGLYPVYEVVPVTTMVAIGPEYAPTFVPQTTYELVVVGYSASPDPTAGGLSSSSFTTTTTTCLPEQPYIPPTPPTPGTPDDYHLGWNSGARENAYSGNLKYFFQAHPAIQGVVTGLTRPEKDTDYGYFGIDYGFHFQYGFFRVLENGVGKTAYNPYTIMDIFSVRRKGKYVSYYKNSELIYTSTNLALRTPLSVDLSMYSGGDTIFEAYTIETPLDGYGEADFTLPPLFVIGGDPGGYANIRLPTIEVTGSGYSINGGDLTLPALQVLGGDYNYGEAHIKLPSLKTYGESGYMSPGLPSAGSITLPVMQVGGLIVVGGVGEANITLPSLAVLGGDHNFGQGSITLPNLIAWGVELPPVGNGGVVTGWPYGTVSGYITAEITSGGIVGPFPFTAFGSGNSGGIVGMFPSSVTGDVSPVMSMGGIVGMFPTTIIGEVFPHSSGGGIIGPFPFTAFGSGNSGGIVGRFPSSVTGDVTPRNGMGGIVRGFPFTVIGEVTPHYDNGGILGPFPFSIVSETADNIVGPFRFAVFGDMTASPEAVTAVTYAINLHNAELTTYTNYNFTQFMRLGGNYYGLTPTGLFLLEGANDNGAAINAHVKTHPNDFGSQRLKRTPNMYVGSDFAVEVTTYTDGDQIGMYTKYHGAKRVNLAKGPSARYWAYKIANVNGGEMKIDGFEPYIEVLSRKV